MNKKQTSSAIVMMLFIAILVVINLIYPITFSIYFVICSVSLLMLVALRKKENKLSLLFPWALTMVSSVLVTHNYLHPDIDVYNNSDYHVLSLKSVDVADGVTLIGEPRENSFFDDPSYHGKLSLHGTEMNCEMSDQPLYVGDGTNYHLANKEQLPSLKESLSVCTDSSRLDISIKNFERNERVDSIQVYLTYSTTQRDFADSLDTSKPYERRDTSLFKRYITESYNLYDMARSGVSFDPNIGQDAEEEYLLSVIRDVDVVKENIVKGGRGTNQTDHTLYAILPRQLPENITILCDNKEVVSRGKAVRPSQPITVSMGQGELFYVGCGERATRPMSCSYPSTKSNGTEQGAGSMIRLSYHMPLMYHFPIEERGEDAEHQRLSRHHIANITTSSEELVQSDVRQAFLYDLFQLPGNSFHINGIVSYDIGDSHTVFKAKFIDSNKDKRKNHSADAKQEDEGLTLCSKNGSIWHFSVDDLRTTSPVTGKSNIFVRDWWIMGIILLMFAFALVVPLSQWPHSRKSNYALGIWMFFAPMIVMRLYLMWRIAVFPPLEQISRRVFMQYRMENGGLRNAMVITLIAIGLMMLLTIIAKLREKKTFHGRLRMLVDQQSDKRLKIVFCLLWFFAYAFHFASNSPFANLFAPLAVFFLNEYLCLKRLPMLWRLINILLTLGAFLSGDPGYAVMFFIFSCLYTAYIMLVYKHSVKHGERKFARQIALVCFILTALCVCLSPWIVGLAYDEAPIFGLRWLTVSRIAMTVIGLMVLWLAYKASEHLPLMQKRPTLKWGLTGIAAIVVLLACTIAVPAYINKNGHFKYRSLIHTKEVGAIMNNENILERNSDRLLQASQNQWFLQYHDNKGKQDRFNGEIFTLSPHFRKGVTWPTQVSDVILSRYVIGEISTLLPVFIIVLSLVFLLLLFRSPNRSAPGRILAWAFALLIAIQMTFVWMANTNRMIFFGQDFPFLSHNALVTTTLFALLLGIAICLYRSHEDTHLRINYLQGLHKFVGSPNMKIFFALYIILFGIVYFTGNRYSSLYGGEEAGRYNLNTTMQQAQSDLDKINASIASYPAKKNHQLKNDEDLTLLWNDIEHDTNVKEDVDRMLSDTTISQFTYSLFEAFRNNLKNRNRFDNVIHLRHVGNHYELALNNGFYSLRSPDEDRESWSGNIYTDVIDTQDDLKEYHLGQEDENFRQIIIPAGWVKGNERVAIIDCRDRQANHYEMYLHHQGESYAMKSLVYPLHKEDIVEFTSKNTKEHPEFTVSLKADENRLLVKNIHVNGHAKPVYLKRDRLYWLREYTNMFAYVKDSCRHENQLITIDGMLQDSVTLSMREHPSGLSMSVIGMDGYGNVRLMADHKGRHYTLDPNDEARISSLIEQTYLNPVPGEERKVFGNMNLYYMLPGPGSSMKPLTYAAVTSQTIGFESLDWETLRLRAAGSVIHKYGIEGLDYDKGKPKGKEGWRSVAGDEIGDGMWIDNHFYLRRSSNFYNALVTYIGMIDMTAEKARTLGDLSANYYPQISLNNNLTGSGSLRHGMADKLDGNLPLFSGLSNNFGLQVNTGGSSANYLLETHHQFINSDVFRNLEHPFEETFVWAYPNLSSAYYSSYNKLAKRHRLQQYTLGASPLQVTPLKMAEMYGRLFSQSRDYHAHITPLYESPVKAWGASNGISKEQLFRFYQHTLFTGMKQCGESGTGVSMVDRSQLPSGYYLYMKTGTLNIDENHPNDRLLAVIITDRDVCEASSPEDYRFYVVYFRYVQVPKGTDIRTQTTETLRQIMKSNSFKDYFRPANTPHHES
ncbi:MAG: hypothetical protein IKX36_06345 [Prevotella sp.]|nr:hypothetical protein [Prevotella sp.]